MQTPIQEYSPVGGREGDADSEGTGQSGSEACKSKWLREFLFC